MKKLSLLLMLVVAACAAGQPSAREDQAAKPSAQAGATFYREGLSGVDLSGLDSVQKERALQIMNGNKCACPCGMSIAQCRVEDKSCPKSPGMAASVVAAVKSGQTDQQIVAALNGMRDPAAPTQAAGGPAAPAKRYDINLAVAPMMGKASAKVSVVLFSDFQCPFCGRAEPVVKQIMQAYPDDVKFYFKEFPLVSIHPFAKPAALAAIAAGKQKKFWEMHDLLFANQRALDAASLRRYAESLGLDMAAFDKDSADPETARFLDQEMLEGSKVGVQGTPTMYVDGVQSPNWDFGTVQKLIDTSKSGGDVATVAGQMTSAMRPAQADPNQVYQIDIAGAPVRGPVGAPVTIVEFSDYQCPFCAQAEPLWKQVMSTYPDKVRFVYKQFPLSFHQNAKSGSMVALFAKEHGKYWEMHDLLFQNNQAMNKSTPDQIIDVYKGYAKQLGLDEAALETAVKSDSYKTTVDKDVEDGRKAAVSGTPSVFINGKRLQRRDFPSIKAMIDGILGGAPAGAAPSSR